MFHIAPDWEYYWGEGANWLVRMIAMFRNEIP